MKVQSEVAKLQQQEQQMKAEQDKYKYEVQKMAKRNKKLKGNYCFHTHTNF